MTLKMKRIGIFIFLLVILFVVSACALPIGNLFNENIKTSTPQVVEDEELSPFENIGCIWKTNSEAVCNQDSIPQKMGCDTLTKPSDYLDLLSPESEFMICSYRADLTHKNDDQDLKGLWDSGCKTPWKQRLLVYTNGDYLLISDREDLKYYFAPITTAEQALGYAIAATGAEAKYDLENLKGYRILTDNLQETTVQTVEGGFEVVLFRYLACGCGPHTTFMQTIKVTSSGDIEFVRSTSAFENPQEDDLCVD